MRRQRQGPSATFATRAGTVLDSITAGASTANAALHAGCSKRTIERWIAKGRLDPTGRYGEFAAAVTEARGARVVANTAAMDEGELLCVLSKAARAGSVPAMRLVWQMLRDQEPGPAEPGGVPEWLDEVSQR